MLQPHLKMKKGDIPKYVLLPGDPDRVDLIGRYLKDFKVQVKNREFKIGIGIYKKIPIAVCSTGIGCPSTAIAVEELINVGVKVLIRIGTCGGSWRKDIPIGSIIIPTASIRDEGTTKEYIPEGFPAVADYGIVQSLCDAAKKKKQRYFVGINRTHDAFYGSQDSIIKWGSYLTDRRWAKYDTPVLSSEMESSVLFVLGSLRGVRTGAIFAVNSDPEPLKDRLAGTKQKVKTEIDNKTSQKVTKRIIEIALDTIVSIEQNSHHNQFF